MKDELQTRSRSNALQAVMFALFCAFWVSKAQTVFEPLFSTQGATSPGTTASGESGDVRSTTTGRFLLFCSTADDLVTNVHNGVVQDLFLYDVAADRLTLVSRSSDALNGGNGSTFQGAVTDDGRWVVFQSEAENLVVDGVASTGAYFLREMETGRTRRIPIPLELSGQINGTRDVHLYGTGRYWSMTSHETPPIG